ncbi:RagB/SusD family nutrient uptake outer membrane protein [Pedobacter frigoris]|nr:RagB/SusD family nutrient uptake outer membrane protein [Pedobacter frigoris]
MKRTDRLFHMNYMYLLIACLIFLGCKKQNDWLDIKANKNDVVPQTLTDFQAILDNTDRMNVTSAAGLPGSDNTYLTDASFSASTQDERNLYTWKKEIWSLDNAITWSYSFRTIGLANVILDGLNKIEAKGEIYNNIKGQALFHRAFAYYNMAQLFCHPYSPSANTDLGLPLRTNSDVTVITQRASLSQTYEQIISDALLATELLATSQTYVQRPVRSAAYALLAKIYLNMGDYTNGAQYADKCLALSPQLLDFNDDTIVNLSTTYRFPAYAKNNPEVLFYTESNQFSQVLASSSSRGFIDRDLYGTYEQEDLRRVYFFATVSTGVKFRGGYSGRSPNFCGLAANEIYFIRAECRARDGDAAGALADLNLVLKNRFKSGSFTEKTTASADDALQIILNERRKEFPATANIRWEDLRRLNQETRFQKTLTRSVNGTSYTLLPNDKRYTLPIPTQEIRLSGIKQNDR